MVFNQADPCIGITLTPGLPNAPHAPGFYGACTQCGWPMHRWDRQKAIESAQRHVDGHDPVLLGGDRDALIYG